ncbi:MAG: hypothetical protein E7383_10765 [Ruminococcaceae bacterium]|nr:hypothetical protein [Oscillospiraceae bacterium]
MFRKITSLLLVLSISFSPGENALPTVCPTNASKITDISVKTCRVQLFHIFNRNNCTKRPIYATVCHFFNQQLQNARSDPKYKGVVSKCRSFFGIFVLISQKNHSNRQGEL